MKTAFLFFFFLFFFFLGVGKPCCVRLSDVEKRENNGQIGENNGQIGENNGQIGIF